MVESVKSTKVELDSDAVRPAVFNNASETTGQYAACSPRQLTDANLALHNAGDATRGRSNPTVEDWLATTADRSAERTLDNKWEDWCDKDKLAADLERMIRTAKKN